MKKKNISEAAPPVESSDPSAVLAYLEETIDRETSRMRAEGSRQIEDLEKKLNQDLDDFKKEENEKAEKIIAEEKERLSRTFEIEGRRIISRVMEELFEEVIREAAERAGSDQAALQRISSAVKEAAGPGDPISVTISPGDELLKEAIEALGLEGVTVTEDPALHGGGAVISSGGDSVLNLTLDRVLFRKKDSLRLEMMTLLREEGLTAKLEELYGSW